MYYLGKKKKHMIKIKLMVNNQGIIIHKLRCIKGRKHHYDIYKKDHSVMPEEIVNIFDLGYLGIEKDFPKQLSYI